MKLNKQEVKKVSFGIYFSKADIKNKNKIYLDLNMFQGSYKFNEGWKYIKNYRR